MRKEQFRHYWVLVPTVLVAIVAATLAVWRDLYGQTQRPRPRPTRFELQWTSVGPTPNAYSTAPTNPDNFNSGRVSSIAVDPGDSTHWLIGYGNGGIWESHDAGASFVPLTDNQPTLAIGAIAFAPSDPNTIYAGTGEAIGGVGFVRSGLGLLKSIDGARKWSLIAAPYFARASVKRVRVHPSNENLLLAATMRGGFGRDSFGASPSPPPFGILKSSDGGITWTRTLGGQATALEVDSTNFNNQYAAIGDQRVGINFNFALPPGSAPYNDPPGDLPNGVYRSTDGGQTWGLVPGPWGTSNSTTATVGDIQLAISPSNPNTLYASIQIPPNGGSSSTGLLGLYRTDNAWAPVPTWISIPTVGDGGYCGPNKCGYSNVISVDPSDPATLFAFGGQDDANTGDYDEGDGAFRCSNCGAMPEWTYIPGPHTDHHAIAWAGNRLIDGNDGGVWSTTDGGNSWQDHNGTISTNMFYSGALHPTNPNFILGGIRDFSVSLRTGTKTWSILPDPPQEWGEAEVALSSSSPDTNWMAGEIFGSISRTTNGGQTAIEADAGIDKTGAAFVAPVRKCPNNDDMFLTGTDRMWRTNNFFSSTTPSWVANSPPDTYPYPNTLGAPNTILSIAFVASDTACNTYAYGTTGGKVKLTRDGGNTWTDLDPGANLPPRPVNGLAFDPTNAAIFYVGLSSFDDGTPGKPGHVFKTTNAIAATPIWSNVSPSLNQPFNVIAVDPVRPLTVYAGSDAGLFYSTDGAGSWKRMGPPNGLPYASVYDIKINPATGMTAAFTYGRGAYILGQAATMSH